MLSFDAKRTKIVCTIGPASASSETIAALIEAGMDVARLNFSHGTYDEHAELIRRIRSAADAAGRQVAILQDLQGPKIRVGVLPDAGVTLEAGARVVFTADAGDPATRRLHVTYDRLSQDVKPGERILLDDGLLSAKILSVEGRDVVCEVVDGGTLTSHKGVNFPESRLGVSPITEKDKADLAFGVAQRVDWVALSFVRTGREAHELRELIEEHERALGADRPATAIRTIAKIEKAEAVGAITEILEAVDAIMVARGDLGIEMVAARVPVIQKDLIAACRAAGKPVIVATQMLDSMIRNPRPTRAEVSDVANAVIDHADAVMLSGETAGGRHPVAAAAVMAEVIRETERSAYDDVGPEGAVAEVLARDPRIKAFLALSVEAASRLSQARTERPVYAAVADARACRQLSVSWGIRPFLLEPSGDAAVYRDRAIGRLTTERLLAPGDRLAIAGDPSTDAPFDIRELH